MPEELWKLLASIALCNLAGGLGALVTMPRIPGWYRALRKPSFNPPSWVFGPVWTTLYTLMGVSFYLVWRGHSLAEIPAPAAAFAFQLVVNVAWSGVFFGLRSPLGGLVVIGVLLGAILWMLFEFHACSPTAALLQAPYLLWCSFAAVLNFRIWQLNPEE